MHLTITDLGGISTLDSAQSRRMLDACLVKDDAASVVQDAADVRTRAARAEIRKLGAVNEPEAVALLASLIAAFATGRVLSNSSRGIAAIDSLLDAVHVLENGL